MTLPQIHDNVDKTLTVFQSTMLTRDFQNVKIVDMDSTFLPVHNTRLIAGIVDDGLSGFSSLLYQLLLLLHNLHDLLKLLCVQLLNRGVLVACKDTYT